MTIYITPGTWRVDDERHAVVTDTPTNERGSEHDVVAECPGDRAAHWWEAGDGRAIAALPDLIAAVRAAALLLSSTDGTEARRTEARRMLATALDKAGVSL